MVLLPRQHRPLLLPILLLLLLPRLQQGHRLLPLDPRDLLDDVLHRLLRARGLALNQEPYFVGAHLSLLFLFKSPAPAGGNGSGSELATSGSGGDAEARFQGRGVYNRTRRASACACCSSLGKKARQRAEGGAPSAARHERARNTAHACATIPRPWRRKTSAKKTVSGAVASSLLSIFVRGCSCSRILPGVEEWRSEKEGMDEWW